uniref:Uncharacterized protein n=1 Tax=Mycena chlorophos TaxID=658473 RepID=A0ABQ0LA73_MYCCL|nr:predicted protein [Mycena chlorophos]
MPHIARRPSSTSWSARAPTSPNLHIPPLPVRRDASEGWTRVQGARLHAIPRHVHAVGLCTSGRKPRWFYPPSPPLPLHYTPVTFPALEATGEAKLCAVLHFHHFDTDHGLLQSLLRQNQRLRAFSGTSIIRWYRGLR